MNLRLFGKDREPEYASPDLISKPLPEQAYAFTFKRRSVAARVRNRGVSGQTAETLLDRQLSSISRPKAD